MGPTLFLPQAARNKSAAGPRPHLGLLLLRSGLFAAAESSLRFHSALPPLSLYCRQNILSEKVCFSERDRRSAPMVLKNRETRKLRARRAVRTGAYLSSIISSTHLHAEVTGTLTQIFWSVSSPKVVTQTALAAIMRGITARTSGDRAPFKE